MIANISGVLVSGSVGPANPPVQTVFWPRGADGQIVLTVVDETGAPVSLAGRTLYLGVATSDTADPRLFVRQGDNTNEAGGVCTFTIGESDTSALSGATLRFDCWEQDINGRVPVTKPGNFVIMDAIVRVGDTPSSPGPIPPVAGWSVAHVSDLAALPVLGTSTGRRIFVAENLKTYVLVANVAGAADGFFVVAPPDDTSRQWAWDGLLGGGAVCLSSESDVDLTVAAATLIAPGLIGKRFVGQRMGLMNTQIAGSVSGAGTDEMGNTSFPANLIASRSSVLTSALFAAGVGWYTETQIPNPQTNAPVVGDPVNYTIAVGVTGSSLIWRAKVFVWGTYL